MDNQTLGDNLAAIVSEATAAGGVVVDIIKNAVDEIKASPGEIQPPEHLITEHSVDVASAPVDVPADTSVHVDAAAASSAASAPTPDTTEEYMKQFERVQEYIGVGSKFVSALHDAPDDEARVKALIAHCKHLHELLQETYKLIVHQHNFFSPE